MLYSSANISVLRSILHMNGLPGCRQYYPPPPPLLQKNQCKINNQRKSTVRRNNIYFQHFTEASERVRKCEKSTTKKKRRFFLPLHHMPVYSSICIFRLENVFRVPVQAHSLNLSRLHIYWVRDNSQRWNVKSTSRECWLNEKIAVWWWTDEPMQ